MAGMVCVANGENRSETCEYALTPGSVPYRALTRFKASPLPAAGKNWPIAGGGPARAPGGRHR